MGERARTTNSTRRSEADPTRLAPSGVPASEVTETPTRWSLDSHQLRQRLHDAMPSFGTVRRVGNAMAGWAILGVLGTAYVRAGTDLDPLWVALSALVVGVALVPVVLQRSVLTLPTWPLLALAFVPLIVRVVGADALADVLTVLVTTTKAYAGVGISVPPARLDNVAFLGYHYADVLAVGMLSVLTVSNLQRFSAVNLTTAFAALLVAITTVGLGGGWAVIRWVSDFYFGTGFLVTNDTLMIEFTGTTAAALVAAAIGTPLFCRARLSVKRREPRVITLESRPILFRRLDDVLIIGLQLSILGILVYGVLEDKTVLVLNAVFALVISQVASVFERGSRRPVYRTLVLWVTAAALFHAAGFLGLYGSYIWWDDVAHTLSASAVAAVGYTGARAFDARDERLRLPDSLLFVYVLLFVVTAGVVWELFEFALTGIAPMFGIRAPLIQKGLDDTVMDLVFDILGGLLIAVGSTLYTRTVVDDASATDSS